MVINKNCRDIVHVMHVVQCIEMGGLETLVVEMCKHTDNSIFKVSVLCLDKYDEEYVFDLIKLGIEIFTVRKYGKFDISFIRRAKNLILDKNVDILHAHSGCLFYAALFSIFCKIKIFIFTAHGMPIFNTFKDIIEDNIASFSCYKIISVSNEINNRLKSRMPLARKKISLIINGVNSSKFVPSHSLEERNLIRIKYELSPHDFVIGSVGRLEAVKNYDMLLKAFSVICSDSKNNKSHMVLIGDGSRRKHLEEMAARMGLAEHVSFLGMQYRINEILPMFDVFVLSSITEGTSIALLEAQSCGIPAVVTDVGGNGFVVRHGENGFLCAVDDVEAMATALRRLRDEPETAKNMAQAARQRVLDGLDLNSMIVQYQRLYLQHD
jgi:glycosyltransferase involved in cell wall biosynthesis